MERSNFCMGQSDFCMGRSDFDYGAKWLSVGAKWLGAKWPDTSGYNEEALRFLWLDRQNHYLRFTVSSGEYWTSGQINYILEPACTFAWIGLQEISYNFEQNWWLWGFLHLGRLIQHLQFLLLKKHWVNLRLQIEIKEILRLHYMYIYT